MDDHLRQLGELFVWFADTSAAGYSPLYDALARGLAGDETLLGLVAEAPPHAHQPALIFAAAHYLVLEGSGHPLGEAFRGTFDGDPVPLFRDFCHAHREALLDVMARRRVQTNEVGRSALIGPALRWVAERFDEPLELYDVGCSAGLNLLCDAFLLDYGERGTMGPPEATTVVPCEVLAGEPPITARLPRISRRLGVDLDPPDLGNPEDARWLEACVWPDTGRLPRTRAAIAEGRRRQPEVVRGNALEVVPALLGRPTEALRCVVTTWSFSYLSLDDRQRFVEGLADAGRRRPVVWIVGDGVGVAPLSQPPPEPLAEGTRDLLTAIWFSGQESHAELLASVQSHGAALAWLG